MHLLPNALLQEPREVLPCTLTLLLEATEIGNATHVLNDAARGTSKLLASGPCPAKSIAVVVLFDDHGISSETFRGAFRISHGLSEVLGQLHLNGCHYFELCTTTSTL